MHYIDNSFFRRLLDKNEPISAAVSNPFWVALSFKKKELIAKMMKIIERIKNGWILELLEINSGKNLLGSNSLRKEIRDRGYIPSTTNASNNPEAKIKIKVFKYLDLIPLGKSFHKFSNDLKIFRFLLDKLLISCSWIINK